MKTVCCTGHRPKGFPWNYRDVDCSSHQEYLESLACEIESLIRVEGFDYFISGGAIGADMDFADIVIGFRDNYYPHIKLEVAVPCRNQDLKWNDEDKTRYQKILHRANTVNVMSENYTPTCMLDRNKYMVDQSNLVIAVWNGEMRGGTFNTINYSKKVGKPINYIMLKDYSLPDSADFKN
ncbi:MAG: SLOG family protein [Clostridia bacterium]|nr:SLOG family protein [Clostridia bacterium]